jgi:hypothetical protein
MNRIENNDEQIELPAYEIVAGTLCRRKAMVIRGYLTRRYCFNLPP